jgi:uncharacterized protein (DUF433 family)
MNRQQRVERATALIAYYTTHTVEECVAKFKLSSTRVRDILVENGVLLRRDPFLRPTPLNQKTSRNADLIAYYADDHTLLQCAEHFNLSRERVRQILHDHHVPSVAHYKRGVDLTEIADRYQAGDTIHRLCIDYNKSSRSIVKILQDVGIALRLPHGKPGDDDIVAYYRLGYNIAECAAQFGRVWGTVRRVLIRHHQSLLPAGCRWDRQQRAKYLSAEMENGPDV